MSAFDLFGDPLPVHSQPANLANRPSQPKPNKPSAAGVQPATPHADWLHLGAARPAGVFLGTSSWSFPGWRGLVYANAHSDSELSRKGLAAYSAHPLLNSVGIDRTFYAPIALADYRRYAEQVPDSFRFLIKAPMALTAASIRQGDTASYAINPGFLNVDAAIEQFIAPCSAGLGAKAGPLTFQFPPQGLAVKQPERFAAQLGEFLRALPQGPLYAVELRDRELMTRDLCAALSGHATLCLAGHARMPGIDKQARLWRALVAANPHQPVPLVLRWNLHAGKKYDEAKAHYQPFNQLVEEDLPTRTAAVALLREAMAAGQSAWVIVNNKAEGCAPLSIEKLLTALVTPM